MPRPPDTFIGRDHELALLERLLSRQHLVVVKGIGGIGKTALALSWTERLRATQPDAVVWFGRCTPQSGIDALFPQVASASPDETAAALIEAANAARALLVIDDLHLLAPDQAATLLRQLHTYLGGHAVITTREDLPLTALESVDIAQMKLEGLPSPAAASLLGDLLALHPGAPVPSPGSATALVEAVGGHPLFIRLMASLLVNRLADADALARGALPVGLREDLLEKVVGDVPPPERAVLEVLALARAPLPDTALAQLSGVPDASILRAALERRLLVERESPERILVHHLLADHVTASTTPQRRQALHLGLARWWREQGQSARSFHHFVEANQLAAAADTLETVAPTLCASAQHDLLLDGIRRLETGGQPPGPRARVAQANALSVLGRSVESLEVLTPLIAPSVPPPLRLEALAALASVHLDRGHFSEALRVYEEALALCDEVDEVDAPAVRSKCLNYTALIHGYRGEMDQARTRLERSLRLAQASGSTAGRAHALRISATLEALEGRYDVALQLARESRALAHALASVRMTCWARYAEGLALLGRGAHAAAREALEENLRDGGRAGGLHVQAYARLDLATLEAAEGNLTLATSHLDESIKAFNRQGYAMGVAMAELRLARLHHAAGRDEQAHALLERVIETASTLGNPRLEAEARRLQEELTRVRGDAQPHGRLVVVTREGCHPCTEDELTRLRGRADTFALFLDMPRRTLRVEGKGDVPIFRRPVLLRLLTTLVRAGSEISSAEALVPQVWGFPYEGESSALEVRKAVSRLRDLVEADRAAPLWIVRHEARVGRRGGYRFEAAGLFCAILDADDGPAPGEAQPRFTTPRG